MAIGILRKQENGSVMAHRLCGRFLPIVTLPGLCREKYTGGNLRICVCRGLTVTLVREP